MFPLTRSLDTLTRQHVPTARYLLNREPQGIPKEPTGIAGFDELPGGHIPGGRTTLIAGGSGCGKSVFALQSIVHDAGVRDISREVEVRTVQSRGAVEDDDDRKRAAAARAQDCRKVNEALAG